MSVFASKTQETIAIPNGDGATVTLRRLTPREFETYTQQQIDRGKGGTFDADARRDLFLLAVVKWTLDREIGAEAFDDLDAETADWLLGRALKLYAPKAYKTVEEIEAAQKKTAGPIPSVGGNRAATVAVESLAAV